jgi:hypothetical protein
MSHILAENIMYLHIYDIVGDVNVIQSAHACSSLMDFSTLKMEAIHSSKTSVHARST